MSKELTIKRRDIQEWTGQPCPELVARSLLDSGKNSREPLGLIAEVWPSLAAILQNAPIEVMEKWDGGAWRPFVASAGCRQPHLTYRLHPDVTVVGDTITCVVPVNPTDDEKRGFIEMVIKRHRLRNVGTVALDTMYGMMVRVAQRASGDDKDGGYEFAEVKRSALMNRWAFSWQDGLWGLTTAPDHGSICTKVKDASGQIGYVVSWPPQRDEVGVRWAFPSVEAVVEYGEPTVRLDGDVSPKNVVFKKGD